MPAAPRVKDKGTKIAYRVMGVPQNIKHKPTKRERFINRRLLYEETYRAR